MDIPTCPNCRRGATTISQEPARAPTRRSVLCPWCHGSWVETKAAPGPNHAWEFVRWVYEPRSRFDGKWKKR